MGWDSSTSHSISEPEEPDGGSHCGTDSPQWSFVGTDSRWRFGGALIQSLFRQEY